MGLWGPREISVLHHMTYHIIYIFTVCVTPNRWPMRSPMAAWGNSSCEVVALAAAPIDLDGAADGRDCYLGARAGSCWLCQARTITLRPHLALPLASCISSWEKWDTSRAHLRVLEIRCVLCETEAPALPHTA